MVAFRASAFFFSLGTFWYGENSTTAWDSFPGFTFNIIIGFKVHRRLPALSRKRCPSYSRLNWASCSSSRNAMYAREGMFSLFNLWHLHQHMYPGYFIAVKYIPLPKLSYMIWLPSHRFIIHPSLYALPKNVLGEVRWESPHDSLQALVWL